MPKIRVLVVDDSVVVRRMVSDVIAADPSLEVAGTAPDGRIALAKIPQVNPDVVTLDVEMPVMDGLETLAAIRRAYPQLPIIMFSTLTQRGATATLDALSLGANDYVTKPANIGSVSEGLHRLREQLLPKIKQWCTPTPRHEDLSLRSGGTGIFAPAPRKASARLPLIDVLVIGVSTGGPNALSTLMPMLPGDFPIPILIVQHMPPVFTRLLAERLAAQSAFPIREAVTGDQIRPGSAYLAPGNYHMVAVQEGGGKYIRTNQNPPENSCRPAVDVLFRSVVRIYGSGTLGVILTGMGQDGLRGCEHIREAGGQILAQDEQSSVVWGMPGFVVRAGLADQVLPLKGIADAIVQRVRRGRADHPARSGASSL